MKSRLKTNGAFIWIVCSAYIVLVTIIFAIILLDNELKVTTKIWLGFIFGMIPILFENSYWFIARHGKYSLQLVRGITNCWTIYSIVSGFLFYMLIFTCLIMAAQCTVVETRKGVYFVVIIAFASLVSIKPIIPFVKKEKYAGKRRQNPSSLLNAFVPRFTILYTFVVYYIISYIRDHTSNDIMPFLCVVYIGVERLINMFQTISEYSRQGYYSLFRDTVKWIRKQRKMD